jgi:predicted house-cleaning noncanonical NTP pyrophosphatase (MazG superfamily)
MKITIEDFEEILEVKLSEEAIKFVNDNNFEYELANPEEQNAGLVKIINFLLEYKKESGPEYREIWEKGWQQNLDSFIASGQLSDLIPRFVRKREMIRFKGRWICPVDAEFETNFVMVLRDAIFRENFSESTSIWEFGSGTGLN